MAEIKAPGPKGQVWKCQEHLNGHLECERGGGQKKGAGRFYKRDIVLERFYISCLYGKNYKSSNNLT